MKIKEALGYRKTNEFLEAIKVANGGKEIIWIDMDGVVADFEQYAEILGKEKGMTSKEFIDNKLYRTKGFYENLPLMEGAVDAINELDEEYTIYLLSAPSWDCPESFTEKRVWVEKNFGERFSKRMDLSFHKGHYMGHYLIDDRTKYGAEDFIGEHIMYGSEEYPDWKSVLKKIRK